MRMQIRSSDREKPSRQERNALRSPLGGIRRVCSQDLIARWRAGDEQALKDLWSTTRARAAAKRHGGVRVTLGEAADAADEVDVLGVDEALTRLSQFDEQQARIVELRFFGGLSIQETADALHISESTVKRDWTMARTWLSRELQSTASQ
jgi:RNA polymerase sigma factor (sigma-70 family)